MAKAKTKKKKDTEVIDFTKPEKISEEQLQKMQGLVGTLNRAHSEIGMIELTKHKLITAVQSMDSDLSALQEEFQKDYGTYDVNIQDGSINYSDSEVN
jgi:uncharacterized protein YihD (DUF1040 family)